MERKCALNLIDKTKSGVNSVISPPAQTSELSARGFEVGKEYNKVNTWLENNKDVSVEIKVIISLMAEAGLRVSEALSIKASDILSNGQIRIKSKKRGQVRFITPFRYGELWKSKKLQIVSYIQCVDRFFIYRICEKYGFYFNAGANKNRKVTHYFRYLYMQSLLLNDLNESERATIVGHSSKKSQLYYYDKTLKQV